MSSSHSFPDFRLYRVLWLIIAAVLVLLMVLLPGALAAQEEIDPFQELLLKKTNFDAETRAALEDGQSVEVLVTFRDRDDDAAPMLKQSVDEEEGLQGQLEYRAALWSLYKDLVLHDLEEQDLAVEVLRDFDSLPIAKVQLSGKAQAEALLNHPDVLGLSINERHLASTAQSLPLINHQGALAVVHGSSSQLGANTSVVVIDSGVDFTHPAFGECEEAGEDGCAVTYARDIAPDDGVADDTGHGTNVAGVVLAVAPGTKIISLDVFQDLGGSEREALTEDIIDAVNWAIRHTYWHKIAAVNLSLGVRRRFGFCGADSTWSPYSIAFGLLHDYGIVPVAASGNEADPNRVDEPACSSKAVAVGSVLDSGVSGLNFRNYQYRDCAETSGTPADTVSCFSNAGPTLDLLAPGDKISAAGITTQGTSQAAPHVSGAVAILRSYYRFETVPETVRRMTQTGVPITDHRNNQVYPRLDLGAALEVDPCSLNPLAPGCVFGRLDCGQRIDGILCSRFRDAILDLCGSKPWVCFEPSPTEPLQEFDPDRFRGRRF